MVSFEKFAGMAMSFAEVATVPHFNKTAFRTKKKIFATVDIEKNQAFLKFSLHDQSVFCSFDKNIIYPVPNKWGLQGWTVFELKLIKSSMMKDALQVAFETGK